MTTLSCQEASALAAKLRVWPPGMGYAVVRDETRSRGWRRHPMRQWDPPPPEETCEVMHCPVTQLHVMRGLGRNLHSEHLACFWIIAEALAQVWRVDRETARRRYNDLLKTSPSEIADALDQYRRSLGRP